MDRLLQRASIPACIVVAALTVGLSGCAAATGPSASGGRSPAPETDPVAAGPAASPVKTSVSAPASAFLSVPPAAAIPPGRYAWRWPGGRIAFDIPAGWTGRDDGSVLRHPDTPAEIGLGYWLPGTWSEVSQVYDDACGPDGKLVPVGPTTRDLVAALGAQLGSHAMVAAVEIDGRPASRIEIGPDPGIDLARCRNGADGPFQIWFQESGGYLTVFPAPDGSYGRAIIWSVDVDGDRLIVTSRSDRASDPDDLAEIRDMVASMTID